MGFYDSQPVPDNNDQARRNAKRLHFCATNALQMLEEQTRVSEAYENRLIDRENQISVRERENEKLAARVRELHDDNTKLLGRCERMEAGLQEEEERNFRFRRESNAKDDTINALRMQVNDLQAKNKSLMEEQGLSQLRDNERNLRALVMWMIERLGHDDDSQTFLQRGALRQFTACGMKIHAIKFVREHSDRFGISHGLREAKEYIENDCTREIDAK
jgi:predicted RNase H-like nuclease (RuvC/YqgF family)